ncbi:MAG: hypothetical protein HND56_01495 [Pseudomonadota bacterium]|jgi:hypothetical protein|nr:hypothetical protein [Pseudomonadota bacterium]QKK04437.1 MAG: hypothetical protein HND56_01495 [Pseudomonadota bacterium]|tara:strand:- start:1565 stop:2122 length:558 start_codon:yes stop_codon:yes gene_type:complete
MFKKRLFKKLLTVTVLCAPLLMAGCSGLKKGKIAPSLRCPQTGLMHYTDTAVFKDAAGQETAFVALQDFRGSCDFVQKGEKAVDIKLDLSFYAENRKTDTPLTQKDFSYFIAILGPDEAILTKEVFPLSIEFDKESGAGLAVENVQQHIPLADLALSARYKIIFGLQLTQEQLTENKRGPLKTAQ